MAQPPPVTSVAAARKALELDSSADDVLSEIWASCEEALVRLCAGYAFVAQTLTDKIIPAPPSRKLRFPWRPIRGVTSIYRNLGAKGDPSLFTADTLLAAYTDYLLELDPLTDLNRDGIILCLTGDWGGMYAHARDRLNTRGEIVPSPGALKVTIDVGPPQVPINAIKAVHTACGLMYDRRKTGIPLSSEAWNGRSVSYAGPFTADWAFSTPDVKGLLATFQEYGC